MHTDVSPFHLEFPRSAKKVPFTLFFFSCCFTQGLLPPVTFQQKVVHRIELCDFFSLPRRNQTHQESLSSDCPIPSCPLHALRSRMPRICDAYIYGRSDFQLICIIGFSQPVSVGSTCAYNWAALWRKLYVELRTSRQVRTQRFPEKKKGDRVSICTIKFPGLT